MQLVINIEKRHFIIITTLICLIGLLTLGSATDVNMNDAWHELSQIARTDSDMTSVDSNADGIIDNAQNLTGGTNSYSKNDLIMLNHNIYDLGNLFFGENNARTDTQIRFEMADNDYGHIYASQEGSTDDGVFWLTVGDNDDDKINIGGDPNMCCGSPDWLSVTGQGNINMRNNEISNLQDPDDPQDAATKDYVDNNGMSNCQICMQQCIYEYEKNKWQCSNWKCKNEGDTGIITTPGHYDGDNSEKSGTRSRIKFRLDC